MKIFNSMIKDYNIAPNFHTYSSLVLVLVSNGSVDKAVHYLEEMIRLRVNPSNSTYMSVIRGCYKIYQTTYDVQISHQLTNLSYRKALDIAKTLAASPSIIFTTWDWLNLLEMAIEYEDTTAIRFYLDQIR